jgi:PAS domain S-box-containing protein
MNAGGEAMRHRLTAAAASQPQGAEGPDLFRAAFIASPDALVLIDDEGRYLEVNPATCALLGRTRQEILGHRVGELGAAGFDGRAALGRLRDRRVLRGRVRIVRPDGSEREVEFQAVAAVAPGVHQLVLRDVSAPLALPSADDTHRLFEEAQKVAELGVWIAGADPLAPPYLSAGAYRVTGVPDGTPLTGELLVSLVHPEDREAAVRWGLAALAGAGDSPLECRLVRPDGAVRWVHARAFPDRAPGRTPRLFGILQDVSDRRRMVDQLAASERLYRRIVEGSADGIWLNDEDGGTLFMSPRTADLLGYPHEEASRLPIWAFMDEPTRAEVRRRRAIRLPGVPQEYEVPLRRKDGSEIWVAVQATSLVDERGRAQGNLAMLRDISDRRAVFEARSRLAAIVDSTDDAIVATDLAGVITSWNRGAERLYGWAADEVVGRPLAAVVPLDQHDDLAAELAAIARGERVGQRELTSRRKDGTWFPFALTVSPLRDAAGQMIGACGIARDLSEKKRTEQKLLQAQKMEAVGGLAAGIAHDFNNILSVILSYAGMMLSGLGPGDPLAEDVEEVRKAARRAADLTRQLLAFSRQQVLEPRILDLEQTVAGMEKMLRRLVGEDVELALLAAPDLGRVHADPGQIEQVILNLAVNARDAMPRGGKLTIETTNACVERDDDLAGIGRGRYVRLAVSDTGCGMDEATRQRIFEPFFTTKEKGKGTGLGLATVFGIVRQSGGHIAVDSEPGRGSTFDIYLPRTDSIEEELAASRPRMALTGSETVLIVEDEEPVRAVARAILRRSGYTVLTAQNGGEALLICERHAGRIDLLLTDVIMPFLDGRQVAERLVSLRPDLKVLFMSGYTDDVIAPHGVLEPGLMFVHKPITPDTLLAKVREALDGAPS